MFVRQVSQIDGRFRHQLRLLCQEYQSRSQSTGLKELRLACRASIFVVMINKITTRIDVPRKAITNQRGKGFTKNGGPDSTGSSGFGGKTSDASYGFIAANPFYFWKFGTLPVARHREHQSYDPKLNPTFPAIALYVAKISPGWRDRDLPPRFRMRSTTPKVFCLSRYSSAFSLASL